MSDDPTTARPDPADREELRTQHTRGAWFVLLPALTFVAGLLLSWLVVGVALDDDAPDRVGADPSEPTSPSPGTGVVVPDACIEAVDTAQQAISSIQDGARALRDFRPEEVIDLLDELEDLDQQAREQIATCQDARIQDLP